MNKEEVCFKLIELYYKNIYKSYSMSLRDLFENYNEMLEIIGSDDNEKI